MPGSVCLEKDHLIRTKSVARPQGWKKYMRRDLRPGDPSERLCGAVHSACHFVNAAHTAGDCRIYVLVKTEC